MKKIKTKEAVGTKLAHDITEIRPGEFKGPAFREGHTVRMAKESDSTGSAFPYLP